MSNQTSQHILNTSATLLGFCLIVITALHISNQVETNIIDKLTSVVAILLTFSCILSFVSIRTANPVLEKRIETIADYFFLFALLGILIIIIFISINFIS